MNECPTCGRWTKSADRMTPDGLHHVECPERAPHFAWKPPEVKEDEQREDFRAGNAN